MPSDFITKQLEKLLEGKTLLILADEDFEELVLSAVPNLRGAAEDLEQEGDFLKARRLKALARELDSSPSALSPRIINVPVHVM